MIRTTAQTCWAFVQRRNNAYIALDHAAANWGPLPRETQDFLWGLPAFKIPSKASVLGYDANGRCDALERPAALKDAEQHEGRDLYRLYASSEAGFRAPRVLGVIWFLLGQTRPSLPGGLGYGFGASGNLET
jgi:hypothetical protein